MNDVARDIQDPETKLSVWKRAQLGTIRTGSEEEKREARGRADLRLDMLGGGSDHAPFNNFAGVAALGIGFGGESGGGIYHSIYDDFYWYTHFADTDFAYGKALSQVGGTAMMRLANADLLPFEFGDFADDVQMYVREVKRFAASQQEEAKERNRQIDEGTFAAAADPKQKYVAPSKEEVPPFLNFAPLDNAVEKLDKSAAEYKKALNAANANGGATLANASLAALNGLLIQSEHKLTTPEGLPGRFWYKHELYAPGAYTGYAAKAIPAVREALEQKKWKQAEEAAARVARVLEAEAGLISEAAAKLNSQAK